MLYRHGVLERFTKYYRRFVEHCGDTRKVTRTIIADTIGLDSARVRTLGTGLRGLDKGGICLIRGASTSILNKLHIRLRNMRLSNAIRDHVSNVSGGLGRLMMWKAKFQV